LRKYLFILFFWSFVLADNPPDYFIMKIAAKKDSIVTKYYTRYDPYIYSNENSSKVMKFDSATKGYRTREYFSELMGEDCYLPDSIYCSDTIIKNGKIPFAFVLGYLVDLKQYHSIRIDSILCGASAETFQMLDPKTYKLLTSNKIIDTYDVITEYDASCHYHFIRVVSFDTIWVHDFFMSQFEGYKTFITKIMNQSEYLQKEEQYRNYYKQEQYWNYYVNVLKKDLPKLVVFDAKINEYKISTTKLPNSIRLAIKDNKICVFHYRD